MIKTAGNFTGDFHMRNLVFAHRHQRAAIQQNIGGHQQRITQKTVSPQIFLAELFDLVFVGRDALQPGQRRDHRQHQMQLGMFGHAALDKDRGLGRIDTCGEPVDHHVPGAFFNDGYIVITGRQCMQVGHHKQAFVLALQLDPVLQHAMIVAKVQFAGRAHAGKNAVGEHVFSLEIN